MVITYSKMQTEAMNCVFAVDLPKISTNAITYTDSYYDQIRVSERSLSITVCFSAIVGSELVTRDAVVRIKREALDRVDTEFDENKGLWNLFLIGNGKIAYSLFLQSDVVTQDLAQKFMDWICGDTQRYI